jgi:Pyruvate/2-oxoacid:ferredoxin oxidoreductase delta subunit
MICSWANEGGFNPSVSRITIESDQEGAHFKVRFERNCKNCGLCATYCTSKALVKERSSGDV